MIFRLDNCEFGFTYKGKNYDFEHCDGMTIKDSQSHHLTRGLNAKNKKGIMIAEGLSTPDVITVSIMNVPSSITGLLNEIHDNQERIEASVIDRKTGDSRFIKNAIVSKRVRQLAISEGADDLNIELSLESFDVDDKLKEEKPEK
jgi:hypothetical protein